MKLAVRGLFLLAVLGATLARAQNSAIQHIIVVVQENRTPDNLFQDPNLIAAGADIVAKATGGPCHNQLTNMNVQVPLITRPLHDCVNPDHSHSPAWTTSYRFDHMDGPVRTSIGGAVRPHPCLSNWERSAVLSSVRIRRQFNSGWNADSALLGHR